MPPLIHYTAITNVKKKEEDRRANKGRSEREKRRKRMVGAEILRFDDGTHISAHFNVKEDTRTRASFATIRTWAHRNKYTVARIFKSVAKNIPVSRMLKQFRI